MKKKIVLVGVIAAMGLGAFFVSCEKEEESKSCSCSENGSSARRTIDPSSYGVSNCSDLELKLKVAAAQ
jgi:hypothetical protein